MLQPLRRPKPGRVECRLGGEHAVSTARLRLTGARWSDYALVGRLFRDAEARRWVGWDEEDCVGEPPPQGSDPLLLSLEFLPFVGVVQGTRRIVTMVCLTLCNGSYQVGGVVDPDFRGQGYGREALDAICGLAHHHFGIAQLLAGCEDTNIASQRVLAACGFVRAEGHLHEVLPDGRVIDGMWWQRDDDKAVQRCGWIT